MTDDPPKMYRGGRPYVYRHRFEWRRPVLRIYRPADRRARMTLNRYPGIVIGVAVVLGGHCFSLVWGRPGRLSWYRVADELTDFPAREVPSWKVSR